MTFNEAWEKLEKLADGKYCDLRVSRKGGGQSGVRVQTTVEAYIDRFGFVEAATYEGALLGMELRAQGRDTLTLEQLPLIESCQPAA